MLHVQVTIDWLKARYPELVDLGQDGTLVAFQAGPLLHSSMQVGVQAAQWAGGWGARGKGDSMLKAVRQLGVQQLAI